MALQMIADSLTGMDEGVSKLYIEKDGKFHLDVTGNDKTDFGKIPKARLDEEIAKRKLSDAAVEEIAKGFVENLPEEMRDLVPDLPPAAKIRWIQNATAKGLFTVKTPDSPDSKRPASKAPADFNNMNPRQIMAMGYKK